MGACNNWLSIHVASGVYIKKNQFIALSIE